ncbi:hypothetical protein V496_05688 [Pseudogymnoascus sp. VKM F-4515 (FW-2607)]|nr:hypothetical protein V496_05688 [Pseudogymnoascus sp. VKM F-4515 (FW-2607)]
MASLSRQRKLYASVQTEVAEEPAVTQLTEKFEYFRPTLLSYDELPEWQKDSPFILYGYRPESNSAHACFASWLYLHNETLDFVGIIVLTLGEFVSAIYVGFYCDPGLQRVYWTMIITLCSASIFILLNPRFQGSRWRTFRVCTFVCTGLSGFLPIAHGVKILGFSQMLKQSGMPYYLGEGLLLMLGTLFYTMRIPETFKPGSIRLPP